MFRTAPLALVLALALPSAPTLRAQEPGAPTAGPRVRLWAPALTIGTLVRSDSAVLVIAADAGDTVTVARGAVERADVSAGMHARTLEGVTIGAFAGGFLGGVYGAAAYERPCDPRAQPFCFDFGPGLSIVAGVLIGGLAGAGFGAIIGSQSREETWSPAPRLENPQLTIAPGAIGLKLSIRL